MKDFVFSSSSAECVLGTSPGTAQWRENTHERTRPHCKKCPLFSGVKLSCVVIFVHQQSADHFWNVWVADGQSLQSLGSEVFELELWFSSFYLQEANYCKEMVRALTCVFIKDIHERKCHCLACQQHMTYLGEKGRNTVKNTNLTVNVKETFRKQQVVCKKKKKRNRI